MKTTTMKNQIAANAAAVRAHALAKPASAARRIE